MICRRKSASTPVSTGVAADWRQAGHGRVPDDAADEGMVRVQHSGPVRGKVVRRRRSEKPATRSRTSFSRIVTTLRLKKSDPSSDSSSPLTMASSIPRPMRLRKSSATSFNSSFEIRSGSGTTPLKSAPSYPERQFVIARLRSLRQDAA